MDARKQGPANVPQILKAEVKGKGKKNPTTASSLPIARKRPGVSGCKVPSGASCGEGAAKLGRVSGQKRRCEEEEKANERRSREKKVPVVVLDSDDDELDLEKQQPAPVVQEKKATPADVRAKKRAPTVKINQREEPLPPQFTTEKEKEKKKKQAGIEAKPQREEPLTLKQEIKEEEEEEEEEEDDFNIISEEDYFDEEDEDEDYDDSDYEEEEEEEEEEPVVDEQQQLAPVDDIVRVRNFEGLHILADVVKTEDAGVASRTRLRKGSRRSSEHPESDGKFSQPIQIDDVSPGQCSPVDISSDSSDSEGKGE